MTEQQPTTDQQAGAEKGPAPAPPKPGPPKPGPPRTAPSPAALGGRAGQPRGEQHSVEQVPDSPVPAASKNPSRWGRVDGDGTVYLRTPDGERSIGSWQAGSPDEGLRHFARRFDDMRTEVELLHARITSGSGDTKQAAASARHVRDSLADAAVVGDVAALGERVEELLTLAGAAQEQERRDREEARAGAVARKEELAAEAERIGEESTHWKASGDRLRAILDEWKTIKGIDRRTDDALWKRFAKGREAFNRRRGAHFAELDKQRGVAKRRKAELVEEAEQLAGSTDWGPTAARLRQLMSDWKAAGPAPKGTDDALWERFRGAQDTFFRARSAAFSERDAEFERNAKQKEELIAEAESLDPAQGLEGAKAELRRLQERWDAAGKVPKERIRELEGRFKAAEDHVRSADHARWRRSDPEAQARAAQFAERVAQFESQAAKAHAAGDTRRAREAEQQAAQWREWQAAAENAVADR